MINNIGKRISELRKAKGLTQQELAEKMYIKRELVNYYENETRQPKIVDIVNMSKIFDVTTDYILLGVKCKKADNQEINRRLGLSDNSIAIIENEFINTTDKLKIQILNYLISEHWILLFVNDIGHQMVNFALDNKDMNLGTLSPEELIERKNFTKFKIMDLLGTSFDDLCKKLLPIFEKEIELYAKAHLRSHIETLEKVENQRIKHLDELKDLKKKKAALDENLKKLNENKNNCGDIK